MDAIKEFQGEYRWLSNFWIEPIEYQGRTYRCLENAYQAAKCRCDFMKDQFCNVSPGVAKRMGNQLQIVRGWEDRKVRVMKELLRIKFHKPRLRRQLLDTGDAVLEEGNLWGDIFWGIDLRTGQGQNTLGRLLMEVRQELREE